MAVATAVPKASMPSATCELKGRPHASGSQRGRDETRRSLMRPGRYPLPCSPISGCLPDKTLSSRIPTIHARVAMHPSWCAVARECLHVLELDGLKDPHACNLVPPIPLQRRRRSVSTTAQMFSVCQHTRCEVAQCVQVAFEAPSIAQPQTPPRTGLGSTGG